MEEEKDKKTAKNPSKGQNTLLIVIIIVLAMIGYFGYQYFSSRSQMEERREAMEAQRQIMVEHWQEEGLSQEEIEEKMSEFQHEGFDDGQRPFFFSIMHLFRGGSGSRSGGK